MRKPVVLITVPTIESPASPGPKFAGARVTYSEAVAKAGGIPLMLPPLSDIATAKSALATCDAVLFTGGEDVYPEYYGAEPQENQTYDLQRDAVEFALVSEARRRALPVLAICRGMQVWAVANGCKLVQEVDSDAVAFDHNPDWNDAGAWTRLCHEIEISGGSLLSDLLQQQRFIDVNSLHHQAVDRGSALDSGAVEVVAWAPDGVVEAIELNNYPNFFLGVQSHIEALIYGREPSEIAWLAVFEEFVRVAGRSKRVDDLGVVRGH